MGDAGIFLSCLTAFVAFVTFISVPIGLLARLKKQEAQFVQKQVNLSCDIPEDTPREVELRKILNAELSRGKIVRDDDTEYKYKTLFLWIDKILYVNLAIMSLSVAFTVGIALMLFFDKFQSPKLSIIGVLITAIAVVIHFSILLFRNIIDINETFLDNLF